MRPITHDTTDDIFIAVKVTLFLIWLSVLEWYLLGLMSNGNTTEWSTWEPIRFENFVIDTINAKIDPSWWLNPLSSKGDKHLNPYSKTKKDNQTEQMFLTVKQILPLSAIGKV